MKQLLKYSLCAAALLLLSGCEPSTATAVPPDAGDPMSIRVVNTVFFVGFHLLLIAFILLVGPFFDDRRDKRS